MKMIPGNSAKKKLKLTEPALVEMAPSYIPRKKK
jgi:hypothetical protein